MTRPFYREWTIPELRFLTPDFWRYSGEGSHSQSTEISSLIHSLQVKELEKAREDRLDALRKEWKIACTDQCTMCRETQEELMEAVHLEYEENIGKARIHGDEEARATETEYKDNMDQVKTEGQAEIER